eukprot:TRINITY_DN3782_c1_g1_i1.p1 TRINITY_DN3782_c1_g1~~TRINITY_DN3782_c1_g1_i1.p1  ORF type:complete len:442 (-),score=35.88 TRINITY_DN3782_c1_g1_i1:8-1333(-)
MADASVEDSRPWTISPSAQFKVQSYTVSVTIKRLSDFMKRLARAEKDILYVPLSVCSADLEFVTGEAQIIAEECLEVQHFIVDGALFSLWLRCGRHFKKSIQFDVVLVDPGRLHLDSVDGWFVDTQYECLSDPDVSKWLSENMCATPKELQSGSRLQSQTLDPVDTNVHCLACFDGIPATDKAIQLTYQLFTIQGILFSAVVLSDFTSICPDHPDRFLHSKQYVDQVLGGHHYYLSDFDDCWRDNLEVDFAGERFNIQRYLAARRIPSLGPLLNSSRNVPSPLKIDIPGMRAKSFGVFLACTVGGLPCVRGTLDLEDKHVVLEVMVIADVLECKYLVRDFIRELTLWLPRKPLPAVLSLLDQIEAHDCPERTTLCRGLLHTAAKHIFMDLCRQCASPRLWLLLKKHDITSVAALRSLAREFWSRSVHFVKEVTIGPTVLIA